MELILPWYFFDATATDEIKPGHKAESDAAAEKEKRILCRFCQDPVTDKSKQTTPQGRFVHVRTNPGGFTFEFGCFSDAPGCSATGEATAEHTWFPGHS